MRFAPCLLWWCSGAYQSRYHKVSAYQWQARTDAYAMRQLSFFRCSYFFSLIRAE